LPTGRGRMRREGQVRMRTPEMWMINVFQGV